MSFRLLLVACLLRPALALAVLVLSPAIARAEPGLGILAGLEEDNQQLFDSRATPLIACFTCCIRTSAVPSR